MAFDGLTISAVVSQLNKEIVGGRIYKIAQPEKDELLITIKNNSTQYRLFISAEPSLPLLYLANENKVSPMVAPGFCMLLRKYIQNAKIVSVTQPGFERIVRIELEHLNELGDLCRKWLIIELMGRYSNIILTDDQDMILDSIKHISASVSSVREVLPGRKYFIPTIIEKKNPVTEVRESFLSDERACDNPVFKALYMEYTGFSPAVTKSMCLEANVDKKKKASELTSAEKDCLFDAFKHVTDKVSEDDYIPCLFFKDGTVAEYAPIELNGYDDVKQYESTSMLLIAYYAEMNIIMRIRQKSSDLRHVVQNAMDRCEKKLDIHKQQLIDTEDRDTYRIYGELLNTYGYSAKDGDKSIEVLNYYTNENMVIPLDETMSAKDNAKRYFARYNKLKRTFEAVTKLLEENEAEMQHLASIMNSLDIARSEADLVEIREEIMDAGYIRRKKTAKKQKVTSKPFHYVTADGYHIYVGKNNYQNENLSFKFASGKDIWFHAKKAPGSHVILKVEGDSMPDSAYEAAARLAAHYSSVGGASKVEIDYTERRNLKKPAGSAPGFVIYHTNYSMVASSDISDLAIVED